MHHLAAMSLVEEIVGALRRNGENIDFDALLHLPSDDMRADPGKRTWRCSAASRLSTEGEVGWGKEKPRERVRERE